MTCACQDHCRCCHRSGTEVVGHYEQRGNIYTFIPTGHAPCGGCNGSGVSPRALQWLAEQALAHTPQ